jgi:hypothetical protein
MTQQAQQAQQAVQQPHNSTKRVSDDPLHYIKLILYYSEESEPSVRAFQLLEAHSDVQCVNVRDLAERPVWLKGVPTLVQVSGGEIFTGSGAIAFSEQWCAKQVTPCGKKAALSYAQLDDDLFNADVPALQSSKTRRPLDDRLRADDQQTCERTSLEEYLKLREAIRVA